MTTFNTPSTLAALMAVTLYAVMMWFFMLHR